MLQGEDEYVEEGTEHADRFHTARPVPSRSAPQHTHHQHYAVSNTHFSLYGNLPAVLCSQSARKRQ